MKTNLPFLKPITSPWMNQLIADHPLQKKLLDKYGSPLNVHYLPAFEDNILAYIDILKNYNFQSKIFYARKANKCSSLALSAFKNGIGVDTASYNELKQCLDLGIPAEDLVLTAAIKNEKLLHLAIENDVLIIIDNEDEANKILRLAQKTKKKTIVGFRVSGFAYENKKLKSRFGFDIDEIADFILNFHASDGVKELIQLEGFHFHLDGYSPSQRACAIHQLLDLIETLEPHNFGLNFIDIGGGILMNYLESKQEWKTFQKALKSALLNERKPITYNNDGLGFINRNGKIEGRLDTYPYYNETSKASILKEILDSSVEEQPKTVAQRLQGLNIELRLEPGRSLLDQVGITIARVAHRKKDTEGNYLVGLEMNMTQMASSSADFLLDPYASYATRDKDEKSVEVYFTGAYCLERDVLLKRKIALSQLPEIGDTITFVNTAGYMMHFFETEAHLFELSQNLYITKEHDVLQENDFKNDTPELNS